MNNASETNMSKKVTRKGSGRTKGSFSFVKLTLAELLAKFADKTTPIIVSRKWAEPLGFDVSETTDAKHLTGTIEGTTKETAPKVTIKDLNDED